MWPTDRTKGVSPSLRIPAGEVHLWCACPRSLDDQALLRAYEGLLAAEEARRYDRFRVESARRQYLLTRALVRTALSRYHPLAPAEWRFRTNADGRPEITPDSELRFNASNCDGLVVCAVARGVDVGVDVEPRSRGAAILEIGSRVFSESELDELSRLPPEARSERALSLWTLKESYGKARGVGLSLPVRSLSFDLGGDEVLLTDSGRQDASRFRFKLLDIRSHRLALAIGGELSRFRAWDCVPLVGFERHRPSPTT